MLAIIARGREEVRVEGVPVRECWRLSSRARRGRVLEKASVWDVGLRRGWGRVKYRDFWGGKVATKA